MNGPAVGDHPWLCGTNCGDAKCRRWSPLDQVWQPCMVRGDHPWLPHLVRGGGDCWGTIGSVTEDVVFARHFVATHPPSHAIGVLVVLATPEKTI